MVVLGGSVVLAYREGVLCPRPKLDATKVHCRRAEVEPRDFGDSDRS